MTPRRIMNQSKEQLMRLLDGRAELLPAIHDVLAEHHLSDAAYASIFQLLCSTMVTDPSDEIAFCSPTQEWTKGRRTISDVKLFGLMDKVCDIIRLYVRSSWEECIFSAWISDQELVREEKAMTEMESLAHIRSVLKIASTTMVYSSDGTMDWHDSEETQTSNSDG